jgi:hypothetical protein
MEVYGDECLSRTQVFEWFKRFKEGQGEIKKQVKFRSNNDRFFFAILQFVKQWQCSLTFVDSETSIHADGLRHTSHKGRVLSLFLLSSLLLLSRLPI